MKRQKIALKSARNKADGQQKLTADTNQCNTQKPTFDWQSLTDQTQEMSVEDYF